MTKSIIIKITRTLCVVCICWVFILRDINAFSNIKTTNESLLYSSVYEKLTFEPKLDASDITISIKGDSNIVTLGGTVKHYAEKGIAENTVKSIRAINSI